MTQALEKAFQEAAKIPGAEQEVFGGFILDERPFRAAVRGGIEAADHVNAVRAIEFAEVRRQKRMQVWKAQSPVPAAAGSPRRIP